jgi:hypothetical protein
VKTELILSRLEIQEILKEVSQVEGKVSPIET